ncbi:TetR/AcrR family transcriptional regulator [Methylocella tundrae]|uniref:Transcriptional regulator, TetR family n=1 Tax=Methylocella tundrae TaxID=227605 RepID=A0A4U8Z4E1_METTU|nr:TetR/AcrR family transcriptional regulator [Methylocella tundrae]WPP04062.1 TetR family transcriptional regulator C-terminal domain-containing protein [Methylocella tundrae]VFU10299.1 Transcriptional regulator, TetR family [Methylocella tundrae]
MARASLREKIVDAAVERFHAQGFNGCSVQDITEAAGAPKGSFYNHFKTKELLALEALTRYRKESRTAMLFEGDKPPLQRLRAHFEFLAERLEGWNFERGCMVGNFGAEMADAYPDMRRALAETLLVWSANIASVLRQAQAAGDLSKDKDPELLARFLVDAWEGAVNRARMIKSRAPFDEFLIVAFKALLA